MREYFNKKGLSYGRITILGILLLAFFLIIIFGIYFSPYKNYQDNGNFINNSDGILIKQENGVKTYYLGKGQFKDVIPTVSAQASSPEGSYIDPPIYPELMGEIERSANNLSNTNVRGNILVGGECNPDQDDVCDPSTHRGYMAFPITNISKNASINSASLFFYVTSTNYGSHEAIEFRANNYSNTSAILNGSAADIYLNTTSPGANRYYGIATGTDVSTTGWKNIALSSYALLDLQANLGGYFGVGINGSNISVTVLDLGNAAHSVTIPFSTNKPYIEITYTVGSGSSITSPVIYDGTVSTGGGIITTGATLEIGDSFVAFATNKVAFLTFNLSNIPDSATIDASYLRFNVTAISAEDAWGVTKQLQVTNISSNFCYLSNFSLNNATLHTNITNGGILGFVTGIGLELVDVGIWINNSNTYLQSGLSRDCITYGLKDSSPVNGEVLWISSSEGNFAPQLHVLYTASGDCSPPGSGDWTIDSYCLVNNEVATLTGDIIITSSGFLNMTGTTDLSFDSGRYIYISSGGQINLYDSARFN